MMTLAALWVGFASGFLRDVRLGDLEFWGRCVGIAIIDLTLAGDNALVIALSTRTLPRHQQALGRIWGSLGGIVLRLLFIALVTHLLEIPLAQLTAGIVLIWIALKLVRRDTGVDGRVRQGTSLVEAIWIIIGADVAMSFDNVLAVAAAAEGNYLLVVFGISLSLPLVLWGSGLLAHLMDRRPEVIWLGGGILGYVAGTMMLRDTAVLGWLGDTVRHTLRYPLPLAVGVTITALGWWSAGLARTPRAHPRRRR
jgi:YjbE family integral membrane protein